MTDFTDQLWSLDWSRDGQWLAIARGSVTGDVVTISNFRQAKPGADPRHQNVRRARLESRVVCL